MTTPPSKPDDGKQSATQRVNELLSSPELSRAIESEDFRLVLEHLPIGVVVSRLDGETPLICYANKVFEILSGTPAAGAEGASWSIFDTFKDEDGTRRTLHEAMLAGEDFLGIFCREVEGHRPVLVQAYAGQINNEDGTENYRIAALVDVSERERSQREAFERQIRDKDMMLKEIQHRVKNNLQLITALIRLESRNAQRGETIDLTRLAGRVESLASLYRALEADALKHDVDLGPYVSEIATSAVSTHAFSNIQLELKASSTPVSVNVALPVGLLVNELLTNIFKYAFVGRDGGTIIVECLHDETGYRVVVADDGVGFPPGQQWPTSGKLGWLILQTLRENTAHTDFKVESSPDTGTRVTVDFTTNAARAKVN